LYTLNKPLFFSVIFHLVLFLAFSHQFSQTSLPSKKETKKVKPIQATLYFPPAKEQIKVEDEVEVEVEVEKATPLIEKSEVFPEKSQVSMPVEKVTSPAITNKKPQVMPNQQVINKVLTSDSSTKSISQSALSKLQQRLSNQAQEHSSKDSFNQYLTDKNTIARSTTKLNQLPEAKATIKKVDCDANVLNTAIVITSGLLGGSVRCDSMPNLKAFLAKRAAEKR
jgi:hypothetical protein